jgi:DNA-binding response OmpR family regulator
MPDNTKQSVLIIESDEAILKNLSERFNKQDMLVITAKDGYEGYTRACKESPNIIITEILLPSMNGFRISRLLKYDERYMNITIVLLTSNDLDTVQEMYQASGADQIIKKPFRFKELMEAATGMVSA